MKVNHLRWWCESVLCPIVDHDNRDHPEYFCVIQVLPRAWGHPGLWGKENCVHWTTSSSSSSSYLSSWSLSLEQSNNFLASTLEVPSLFSEGKHHHCNSMHWTAKERSNKLKEGLEFGAFNRENHIYVYFVFCLHLYLPKYKYKVLT